jgi:hypothetical protein
MRFWDQRFSIQIKKKNKSMTTIQRGSFQVVHDQMALRRAANNDLMATDVRMIWEMIMRIIDLYDQRDTQFREGLAWK